MQPLINLKSFLAVLVILIVPAALLVAYFRNYSSAGGGHDHGETGKSGAMSAMKPDDGHAAMGHGEMPESQDGQMQSHKQAGTSQPPVAQLEKEDSHAGMDHGHMAQSAVGQSPPRSGPMPEQTGTAEAREPLGMAATSALPGIPGLSRLYHIGATGFFLNHLELSALTNMQQAALNRLQQQSLLDKSTAQRKIDQAEQELWELTGADEPDLVRIQAKVEAIEKLCGEQRMAFIRSVGEAVKVLTDEQRRTLLGTMAPDDHRHSPANK